MDVSGVMTRYEEVCDEMACKPNTFIMKVLENEKEDQIIDPRGTMEFILPGNNYLLTETRLNDNDALVLYKTLVNNTYVTSLDLKYNEITDEGAKHIGKLIEETCAIESLNLMCNDIGPEGAKHIAKGLQLNETLQSLAINGNKIGNQGGMYFAGALQVNTSLKELDIGDADLGTQSLIAFATVLNHNTTLKALCVNCPLLFSQQEETMVHMSLMLKVNSTLAELHLQKCDLRDFGAERLVETLMDNIALKYLDVRCNRITHDGAKQFAKLLKKCTPLEVLDLGFNRIEDDGAIYLSEALNLMNSNLKTLVLTSNNIHGDGLCAIAKCLHINPTLTAIYIWGNHLEEPACVAFKELVEMRRLDLEDMDVKPYTVDGHVMLSELNHGLRKHYYWKPVYVSDIDNNISAIL